MSAAAAAAPAVGSMRTRLSDPLLIGIFIGAIVGLIGMAVLAILLADQNAEGAPCAPGQPCAPPQGAPRLLAGRVWKSTELGYELEYDPGVWSIERQDGRGLTLRSGSTSLTIDGERSTDAQGLLNRRLADVRARISDLAANDDPGRTLLGPSVGLRRGVGGAYCGTPNGSTGGRVDVIAMAATEGSISTAMSLQSDDCAKGAADSYDFRIADSLLNTLRWPATLSEASHARSRPDTRPVSKLAVARDERLGSTKARERLAFTLVLRLPHESQLERELVAVSNPRSSMFRHFLTPAGFGDRYGLPLRRIDRLRRQLAAAGVAVTASYPQRTSFDVSASAATVSRLFSVRLADFRERASGRRYHLPLSRPRVPRAFRDAVAGVAGLSTRLRPEPADVPADGLKPIDAARAYDVKQLWDAGVRGEGQTIAVFSLGSFTESDIDAFDRAMGIVGARPIEHVPVGVGNDDVTSANAGEVALDLDVVRGIAPRARILNYEVPWNGVASFPTGLKDAIEQITAERRADIVTVSYGLCDVPTLRGGPWLSQDDRHAAEAAFAAAVRTGITIFVASGDQGAYACQRWDASDKRIVPSWPGDSPSVVSVGGTLLDVRQDGAYFDEAGWQDTLSTWGTGGGVSPYDRRPEWQRANGLDTGTANRQVPDVAAAGDDDSGWLTYFGGKPEPRVGGTSASTPFWAALTVLIRQFANKGRLGYLNPVLYELARTKQPYPPFHDVTGGGNRYRDATPGWDAATGLGSPDGFNLARDVAAFLERHS
jgi:Pro-kumamolisin, activation domain/Subtilase family